MQLAQTGTFVGLEDIREYVEFTQADYFDYYRVPPEGYAEIDPLPIFAQEENVHFSP